MTSNQLTYWKIQEDQRSHQANEGLTAREIAEKERANRESEEIKRAMNDETIRHNFVNEEFDRIKLKLEEKGIELKNKEQLIKMAEVWAKYGYKGLYNMPDSLTDEIDKQFGIKSEWSTSQAVGQMFQELGDAWRDFWSIGKSAGALF